MTTTIPEKPGLAELAAALDNYQDGWEARDNALLARIAELEADGRPTLFGSSRPEALPSDSRTALVPVVRSYLGPGDRPTSYRGKRNLATQVSHAGEAVILSWKDEPGDWLDSLLGSFEPLGLTVYGCQNHEPYDNFYPTKVSDFHRRWDLAMPIMARHPHVVPSLILDGTRSETWDDFSRPDVPVWGMDRYNPGIQTPKAYVPPAEIFGEYLEWVQAAKKRSLIAETGTGLVGKDEAGRLAWAIAAHDLLVAEGVEAASWWYSGGCETPLETFMGWLLG